MEGIPQSVTVKAIYGGQARKWKMSSDPIFALFVKEFCNQFDTDDSVLQFKYKDLDGDLVELASNEDWKLALELERNLVIVAGHKVDALPKSVVEFRASLKKLIGDATDLSNSLDSLSLLEKKLTDRDAFKSKRDSIFDSLKLTDRDVSKSEPASMIDSLMFEKVQLNEYPVNSSQSNGVQSSRQISSPQLNDQMYGQRTQGYDSLSPSTNFGFGQQPSSNYGQKSLVQQVPLNSYGQQHQPHQTLQQAPLNGYGQQRQPHQTLQQAPLNDYGQQRQPQQQLPLPPALLPPAPLNGYGQQNQSQQRSPLPPTHYPGQQPTTGNPFQRSNTSSFR